MHTITGSPEAVQASSGPASHTEVTSAPGMRLDARGGSLEAIRENFLHPEVGPSLTQPLMVPPIQTWPELSPVVKHWI